MMAVGRTNDTKAKTSRKWLVFVFCYFLVSMVTFLILPVNFEDLP